MVISQIRINPSLNNIMPRTSITGLCSALYSHLTTADPLESQQPQLPAGLPRVAEMDPGTVYITYLQTQGVAITSLAFEYAAHLSNLPLSSSQESMHKARVEYLSRLEEQHTTLVSSCEVLFAHLQDQFVLSQVRRVSYAFDLSYSSPMCQTCNY